MAWVKIPADNHPVFLAALPKDPRVTTLKMFGGLAAKVNGHMFAGLFAKSFIVKLSDDDRDEAMQLDGAEPFDPMGNGRIMGNTILMPEETFFDDGALESWLRRALSHTLTLPAKAVTPVDKPANKSAGKPAATKPTPPTKAATKPAPSTKAATKPAATKPAATKPAATTKAATKPASMKASSRPAGKPAATATTQPATKKPAANPTATNPAETAKAAARKPASKKR